MKKRLVYISTLLVFVTSVACLKLNAAGELTVYSGTNRTGTSATLNLATVYSGNQIPNSLNNAISSFSLDSGYGVIFAVDSDGTDDGKFYSAQTSTLNQNSLPSALNNKISFIRVVKLWGSIKKKGYARQMEHQPTSGTYTNLDTLGKDLGAKWYYNWSYKRWSTSDMEYAPMQWGKWSLSAFVNRWETRNNPCALAFNEPDNSNQANMSATTAADKYEDLLEVGMRMGSPVTEQDTYGSWLSSFMSECNTRDLRVDFLAAHWYDWGSENLTSTGQQIADRMEAKMINFRNTIGSQNIWLTEFNCNKNRTSQTDHKDFIEKAVTWINSTSWMERYAYFQPPAVSFTESDSTLTDSGNAYKNAPGKSTNYGGTNNLGL